MADSGKYTSKYTGAQIDEAVGKVLTGDNSSGGTDLANYYDKSEIDGALEGKQDKLTAGDNVVIDNNKISVNLEDYPTATQVKSTLKSYQKVLTNETKLGTINGQDFKFGGSINIAGSGASVDLSSYPTKDEMNATIASVVDGEVLLLESYIDEEVEELQGQIDELKSSGGNVDLSSVNAKISEIETEIEPLTETEIDEVWGDTPAVGGVLEGMIFGYQEFTAGTKHPIKRNGYYMCYSNSGNLNLCKSDGTAVVENAKQIQFMVAPSATNPTSTSLKACGMYWSGSSVLSGVEGFRRTTDDGGYITANTEFYVCQMVKGG